MSGDQNAVWSGAALDSRRVVGGELFFALRGEKTDGHRYVAAALARDAAAVVTEHAVEVDEEATVIQVRSAYQALHALTRHVRLRTPQNLVGVTGSSGKTTTKELLAAMLSRRFRVARSPGNLNNLYGFPIALLGIADDAEWMVAEMGMSTPGELAGVSRLGRPGVAIFTNVKPAHLESFKSVSAIADAKAELFRGLDPGGLVIANAADEEVVRIVSRDARGRDVVWFSVAEVSAGAAGQSSGPVASHTAERVEATEEGGARFDWLQGDQRHPVVLRLFGRHNVENFLAAAACADALGVAAKDIIAAAETVEPEAMRGVVHRLEGGSTIVDDCYNSNPEALATILESARELPARRRWAVLGEMLELGSQGPGFHRSSGELAARLGFSPVLGVGAGARALIDGVEAAGGEGVWFETAAAAAASAAARFEGGDLVLVKGSRGVGLEVVVEELLAKELV